MPDDRGNLTTAPRRCFVISPIGAEGSEVRRHADDVFDYIIKPAVDSSGLVALRSDHLHEPGKISEQMFREIVTGDCCVALLTGHNPNVFYELAVAQTVGTPVVALLQKGEAIPFDIQDLRCVRYDLSPRPLFEKVYVKELSAHFARLAANGWASQSAFGDLGAQRMARTGLSGPLIEELTASWPDKRNALSTNQVILLERVELAGSWISQKELAKFTGKPHDDESIYYRMEYLRLLGFIERSINNADRSIRYRLSEGYQAAYEAGKP